MVKFHALLTKLLLESNIFPQPENQKANQKALYDKFEKILGFIS
jgi:hypothetical protein